MQILIVEDEPELRAQIAATLRQQNYTVDTPATVSPAWKGSVEGEAFHFASSYHL